MIHSKSWRNQLLEHEITIGFSGLSHLGIVHAVTTASKGFKVIAKDSSDKKICSLRKGQIDISEPLLKNLLNSYKKNLIFTTETKHFLQCDIVFVSQDVPTDHAGKSDLSSVHMNIEQTMKCLKKEAVLVILSQVPPGFTRELKLKFPDTEIYYQVETLIFGEAINRAQNPERLIIGCSQPKLSLNKAYNKLLTSFQCPIFSMQYESAELTKISINIFLAASVTISNTLAEISELIGADWSEIKQSLKLDKRIGPNSYLNPGLGISGGNLERDLQTVIQLGQKYGSHYQTKNSIIER